MNCFLKPTSFAISSYFIALIVVSCGVKKQSIKPKTETVSAPAKLVFLNYSVKKTDDISKKIRFINTIVTNGSVKKKSEQDLSEGKSGDLICSQLDKHSNILHRILVKNPLSKLIEYADEDRKLQLKKVDLDSAQLSLRLQLKPETKYISISDFKTKKTLLVTNLNQQL
ncbi:hypothetical protein PK35_13940 [Tamlana nanhaiensis]|uniref:Lipoprotein n=1 Tax=Neotamlana nanhaiensis TaxID=1382798 RepID=A0A0D7W0Y4_9FLAO|nr:hypothetical protein [Tamlana nanhaiensis]KJD31512.1 hypothetical protein PK35_13940 [Tamlana nanhaiensis]